MNPSLAKIQIKNLRLRTFIGFNPDEVTKKQDVVVNVTIIYRASDNVLDDQVNEALNYKTVTKKIIEHVEQGRFLLLEKLVGDVLRITHEHPDVVESEVTVDKPHALRFADSVSLTLAYSAREAATLQPLEKAS